MAQVKIPARDIIMQVENVTPGSWVTINGMTSATVNLAENEEVADSTTFENLGQYEQLVMQRGSALTVEGFVLKDNVSGARDPGQARTEVLAKGVGYASRGQVRFRHPVDTNWNVWTATFSLGEQGGGNNDLTSFAATLTRSGATSEVPVA